MSRIPASTFPTGILPIRLAKRLAAPAWLFLLFLTTPVLWRNWPPSLIQRFPALGAVSPKDLLQTTFGHLYIGASILLILTFIVLAKRRLPIILGLTCALGVIQVLTSCIGWGNISTYVLAISLSSVAVEFIRQNGDALRELRRHKQFNFAKVLYRTLRLWSPMLIVGAGGYALLLWLT